MVIIKNPTVKKTTQGRKKIEIKKIEEINNLQVTFSKRRAGLFKKGSELCILTGAEMAIIVESPGGRMFAFGHPSADSIIDGYLSGSSSTGPSMTKPYPPPMQDFNQQYSEISKELEIEKKRKEMIKESKTVNNNGGFWWDEAVDKLGLEELELYVASLEELKKNVGIRADELMMIKGSSLGKSAPLFDVNQPASHVGLDDRLISQGMDYGNNAMVPHGFHFGNRQI